MKTERGFIPPPPERELAQFSVILEQGYVEEEAIRLSGKRSNRQWSFAIAAEAKGNYQNLYRRFDHILLKRCRFSEQLRLRAFDCLCEMIPNAVQHGLPGSRVGILLEVCGHRPNRVVRIMVENFLRPEQANLSPTIRPEEFGKFLEALRGRGLGISMKTAEEILVSMRPGYSLLATAFLNEQSRKGLMV